MVWKFCEIWKILWELTSRWVKFCEILSYSVRYGMYEDSDQTEWAQANLSLHWAHSHFVGFVMRRLKCTACITNSNDLKSLQAKQLFWNLKHMQHQMTNPETVDTL